MISEKIDTTLSDNATVFHGIYHEKQYLHLLKELCSCGSRGSGQRCECERKEYLRFSNRARQHASRHDLMRYWHGSEASEHHNAADILKAYFEQKGLCLWCQVPFVGMKFEVDHKVALFLGGSNAADNICVACRRCNRQRRNTEWFNFKRLEVVQDAS